MIDEDGLLRRAGGSLSDRSEIRQERCAGVGRSNDKAVRSDSANERPVLKTSAIVGIKIVGLIAAGGVGVNHMETRSEGEGINSAEGTGGSSAARITPWAGERVHLEVDGIGPVTVQAGSGGEVERGGGRSGPDVVGKGLDRRGGTSVALGSTFRDVRDGVRKAIQGVDSVVDGIGGDLRVQGANGTFGGAAAEEILARRIDGIDGPVGAGGLHLDVDLAGGKIHGDADWSAAGGEICDRAGGAIDHSNAAVSGAVAGIGDENFVGDGIDGHGDGRDRAGILVYGADATKESASMDHGIHFFA